MEALARDYQQRFKGMDAFEILSFLVGQHPGRLAFSSSLGAEDQVVTHMLCQLGAENCIFTLDTGRMFPETYDLIAKTSARYKFRMRIFFPDAEKVEEMVNSKGINLFYESIENRKLCCNIRKVEPLRRALKGNEIWITGLRREQSSTRTEMEVAAYDPAHQIIKVNPLINWTLDQVWSYIKDHRIPYNTLHDKGFPSIGCQPCTREVMPGEDLRAGRWWWENPDTRECGLHKGKP